MPAETNDAIKLLSNEVQEIISYRPVWILRNGITLFLIIISFLIGATFFISYPDVVHAGAILTSINAPKEVKTKTEGKLIKLYAAEGRYVKQGELLGLMESRASHLEVMFLSQTIDEMQGLMNKGSAEVITRYLLEPYQNLGEAQQAYQAFSQYFILFKQYLQNGYYLKKKTMLRSDMVYLQRLHDNLLQQKEMQVEDAGLAKETFDANQSLKTDKVISPLDYRNEKSKYIGKALAIPQISSAIISNESAQHEKEKEILQVHGLHKAQ